MRNPVITFPYLWQHVTADTLVATSNGVLHTIVLNTCDFKGSVTVYDGLDATGTVLAEIVTDFDQPRTLVFDLKYVVGLFIAVVGTWDLTVNYK